MYKKLSDTIEILLQTEIDEERRELLQPLVNYMKGKTVDNLPTNLNFICTHNSRRSQMAQAWGFAANRHYQQEVNCFSGGVEVTAFNVNAIDALRHAGFGVSVAEGPNPMVSVVCRGGDTPLKMFSKLYDDKINPSVHFAAVMTCSHADEHCPLVSGADQRISLTYEDPKLFDHSDIQQKMYNERSLEIGAELFYLFDKVYSK